MQDFRKLSVWEKSHQLTRDIYKITISFPKEEIYGLRSQIRRSASSIPTNIAEGCGRGGDKDFARFIQISMGSASETEYLLLLAKDLDYLNLENYISLTENCQEVKRMLSSFLKRLNQK